MKSHLLPALKLSFLMLLLVSVVYPALVWGIAQFAPANGKVEFVQQNGKIVGAALVGQSFTQDRYFWSRPSAVNYNAAGSGGSNKAVSNPDYQQTIKARIDTFLVHNPSVKLNEIPSELVTASGSGLDPDLSPQAALIQIARIAKIRNLPIQKLQELVEKQTEKTWLGPEIVNVLALNLALDRL